MDRQRYFPDQIVNDGDMIGLENNVESAIGRVLVDQLQLGKGVVSGLQVSRTQALGVLITPGIAYDGSRPTPQRMSSPAAVLLDCTFDVNGVPTTPSEDMQRAVFITARASRATSFPRTQMDGSSKDFYEREDLVFEILAGEEAESDPPDPAVPDTHVVLANYVAADDTDDLGQDIGLNEHSAVGQLHYDKRQDSLFRVDALNGFDLPLGLKDAVRAIGKATIGNLQVLCADPINGSNKVIVTPGYMSTGTGVARNPSYITCQLSWPGQGSAQRALVYMDASSGFIDVAYSSAVSSGSPPPYVDHSIGFPLAEIVVDQPVGVLNPRIFQASILDVRPFFGRPQPLTSRFHSQKISLANGVALLPLPVGYTYKPGSGDLIVLRHTGGGSALGQVLTPTVDYTETSVSGVTLAVAANGTDTYSFILERNVATSRVVPHAETHASGSSDPIDYSAIDGMIGGGAIIRVSESNTMEIWIEPFSVIAGGRLLRQTTTLQLLVASLPRDVGLTVLTPLNWYYLYASAPSLEYGQPNIVVELSATQPDSGNLYKNGDRSRVYLGPVLCHTADYHLKPFYRRGRETLWAPCKLNSSVTEAGEGALSVSAGFGGAWVATTHESPHSYVNCRTLIPPTTRWGIFAPTYLLGAGSGYAGASVGTPASSGGTDGTGDDFWRATTAVVGHQGHAEGLTDTAGRVVVKALANRVHVNVLGFKE